MQGLTLTHLIKIQLVFQESADGQVMGLFGGGYFRIEVLQQTAVDKTCDDERSEEHTSELQSQ